MQVDLRYHPLANTLVLYLPDREPCWEIVPFPLSLILTGLVEANPEGWLADITQAPRWVQAEAEPLPPMVREVDKVIDIEELDL